MALILKDRVKETATSPGTGSVTLLGASVGFQSFSVVGNGNTCYYTISDQGGPNWEVGIGTYSTTGPTLARTTVLASSNAGSLTNFNAGTQDVFVTYPSEKGVWLDASGNAIGLGTPAAFVGTNITGTASGLSIGGNAATATTAGTVTTNANLTGMVTSVGNAATVVTNANLTGGVTSVGNAATVVTNANLTGAVTSVGNATTMNSGIDSLTDVIIATPVVDQILKYNGSDWVNGAANSISGGSGIEFFNATPIITATGTNNALQILSLSQQPVTTAEQTTTTTSINGTVAASAWLSPALGRTTIDAGIWDYTVFASASGGTTTITRQMYTALPFVTGTVTTTGTGTSRTATASAGTPFATSAIVASATNTLASYLQTPQGLYQITARTSDTVATITTLSTYANESAVAGSVWKLLFALPTSPALTTTIAQYDNTTTQPAFTVTALTKLGGITFVVSTNAGRTVVTTYNGTSRNTHISSPLAVLHNQLGGLQGGTATENYHLTDAEYTGSGTGVFVRASTPTLITPVIGVATGTSLSVSTTVTGAELLASNGLIINNMTIGTTYSIPSGYSASSVGPVVISGGVTVTVPAGSRWVVL